MGLNLFEGSCYTNEGPAANQWCKLPFTYKGKTYTKCTYDESYIGKPWCSVKVNETGDHVENEGNWGYCNEFCPTGFKGNL